MNYFIIPTREELRNELCHKANMLLGRYTNITASAWSLTGHFYSALMQGGCFEDEYDTLTNLITDHDKVLTHFEDFYNSLRLRIMPRLKLDFSLINMLAKVQNRERQFIKMLAVCVYILLHESHQINNSIVLDAVDKLHTRISNIAKRSPYGLKYDLLNRNGYNENIIESFKGSQLGLADFITVNISREYEIVYIIMRLSALCCPRWLSSKEFCDSTIKKAQLYRDYRLESSRYAVKTCFSFHETPPPEYDNLIEGVDFYE